jgi:hypothetical protein
MAHYRQALVALDPINRVIAAEHLYMASENLGQVVFRRLCRQAGLDVSDDRRQMGEHKHQLAIAAGFTAKGNSRQHLYDFDSKVRVDYIFDGNRALYGQLRDASDAFEHGYGGFGDVQADASASADQAFGCIRRAILTEIGVPVDSPLLAVKYDHALGGWQPQLEITGTYTCSRHEAWPHFYGASLFPEIAAIEDVDDNKRTVTLKANASGASLLDGQTLSVESTRWLMPQTPEQNAELSDPDILITRGDHESSGG